MPDELEDLALRFVDDPDDVEALVAATRRRIEWRTRRGGKRCSRCGEVLPVRQFARDSGRSDGLDHRCRACRRRA